MNLAGPKLVVPMNAHRGSIAPQKLDAFYSILGPTDKLHQPNHEPQVRIQTLSPRDAFVELTRGTFNSRYANTARLERQFSTAARLPSLIPIKRLSYPRALDRLHETMAAVIADLACESDRPLMPTAC